MALPSTLNDRIHQSFVELGSTGIPAQRTLLYAADGTALLASNVGDGADGSKSLPIALYGWTGASWDKVRVANVFKNIAAVAITAGTPATIWTPASGKKFRFMGFLLSTTVAGNFLFKDNTTEFLRAPAIAGDFKPPPPMGNGYLSSAADNPLKLDVTVNGTVNGFVFGCEE
jgi:hypothetical protein